nr:unnamed protein product [Leishmania braziliensis]
MSASASSFASPALAVGRSSPNARPLRPLQSTDAVSTEHAGAHATAPTGRPLSRASSSQLIFTQPPGEPLRARPTTSSLEEQELCIGSAAVADERMQRTELLGLIARFSRSLMPVTERLIRLRGALKGLQEQLIVTTPAAAVVSATSGASAGASISSVNVSEASPSPRLCVAGASDVDVEEVLYFLVHRDPPPHRRGAGSGVARGASGIRSPAFSSGSIPAGRPPIPDAGLLVTPRTSPSSTMPRRWSRLESGGGGAEANVMTSASGLWPTSAIGFGDASCPSSPSAPSFRFPSTPPLALTHVSGAYAMMHDSPSPSAISHPCSPLMIDSPSLDQLPVPMVHSCIASGVHHCGVQGSQDNVAISSYPRQTVPSPPLPAMASATTTSATISAAAHNLHQHRALSPYPPLLSVTAGGPQATTPPPPLPAAPANHHVCRVRSTRSLESRMLLSSPFGVVAKDAEAPSYESLPQMVPRDTSSTVEVASEEGAESASTPSMSLSSTMPDLSAAPLPPLPGFSTLTTLEVSGVPSRTPSLQPGTSTVVSLTSPTHQSIIVPGAVNYTVGASSGAAVTSFRRRTGSSQTFAGSSPSPACESPASPTPIMINSLQRTSSQCSEVSEQLHRHHRSLLGSSVLPGAARFITLPTPFFPRAGVSGPGSGGRSLREDSTILSRASSVAAPAMRYVQRVQRRVLTVSQMQLRLSAWDLFHPEHIGAHYRAALQATAAASGVTSPSISPTSGEQSKRRAKNGRESGMSSSGSRLSNSRYQEYSQHSYGTNAVSEMSQRALPGPHWLVSMIEDSVLRYEPLPSAEQPPPFMQSPPVATTSDFIFLCVPYETLARGMEQEVRRGSGINSSNLFGVSADGVGVSVSGDVEVEEVAAVLDILFGLFSGTKQHHLRGQSQRPQPHNATSEAKSRLERVNSASGGGDGEQHVTDSLSSYPHVATRSFIDTIREGSHDDEMALHESTTPEASSQRVRVFTAGTSSAADFPSSTSKRLESTGSLDSDTAILPPQYHMVPGLPVSSSDEWLLPLRQALVDRTIFLLVKPGYEESPKTSGHRAGMSSRTEDADGAFDKRVVHRFLKFTKTHYGVTVQPWRVTIFSYRDATRARNVMLALYAQRLRQQPQQRRRLSINSHSSAEALPQTPRSCSAGEDDVAGKVAPAGCADAFTGSTTSPAPRSGARRSFISTHESSCIAAEVPARTTPGRGQTLDGASLASASRLTLASLVSGSEGRRGCRDGPSCPHDSESGQREFSGAAYALLTQSLCVPPLSVALAQYAPLLERHTASRACSPARFATGTGLAVSTMDEPAEGAAPADVSDSGVDAVAAAVACTHVEEVTWGSSGAAGVGSALRYFQHAAATHRVPRAGFLVMAWSWQLSALLPVIIKDAQSRCNRLRHSSRHAQHKLHGVQRSVELHLAASPAKSVAALEVRLQVGFHEVAQRFLQDLRRLFISAGSAIAATDSSPVSKASSSSSSAWPATGPSAYGQRQQQVPPLAPLDALLVYDSPALREAYQRLTRAVFQFHAFYLAGQFAFDTRSPREFSRTHQDVAHERKPSQPPWATSVYEQCYRALREAMCRSQVQLYTPLRSCKGLTVVPPGESCTRPGTPSPAPLPPPVRAITSATATPTRPASRPTPPHRATPAPMTAKGETEEVPMPKVDLRSSSRPRCHSCLKNAAGSATSSVKESTPLRPAPRSEPIAASHPVAVKDGSDGQPLRQFFSAPSFLTSAACEPAATACPGVASAESTATKSDKDSGHGVSREERTTQRRPSQQASDGAADVDSISRLGFEALQQRCLIMEHQLIAHVSQINTEIINFLLATCVAAVPHLQHDCVGAELARVKDAHAEIVSSFTAVRGRKDAAIAMSHLYARLEEWGADMSHLVSVVRSRPHLEKFITQLRAVLCEDEVRALAVFRGGSDGGQESEDAMRQTSQVSDTPLSSPSAATAARRRSGAAAVGSPLISGAAGASDRLNSRQSASKGSAEQHAATSSSLRSTPCAFASKPLAVVVGHRSARMLRYYICLACKQHGTTNGSGTLSDTGTLVNAQRSGVFGDMLASPSPSRSLHSVQGGISTPISLHRSSRVKEAGGGRGVLDSSVSLSSMSAAWNREEQCLRAEGSGRSQRACGSGGTTSTTVAAFFASPSQPPMAAVSAEMLAALEVVKQGPLTAQRHASAPHALPDAEPGAIALSRDGSLATPTSTGGISATHENKQALNPADGPELRQFVVPVNTSAAAAAAPRCADAGGSAWATQLAQWRSTMTEAERPAHDASAAPLLWIVLDAWDETLLRMPYGLLLHVDTASYAESLNRMSGDLMKMQQRWSSRCKDSLARVKRQLKAMEDDLSRICDESGRARVEYVQELRAVFDAASLFAAPGVTSSLSA